MRESSARVILNSMTDIDIAAEIQRLGLEMEYLSDIASSLGFSDGAEGWTEEFFAALEVYPLDQKREAALRVILAYSSASPE